MMNLLSADAAIVSTDRKCLYVVVRLRRDVVLHFRLVFHVDGRRDDGRSRLVLLLLLPYVKSIEIYEIICFMEIEKRK